MPLLRIHTRRAVYVFHAGRFDSLLGAWKSWRRDALDSRPSPRDRSLSLSRLTVRSAVPLERRVYVSSSFPLSTFRPSWSSLLFPRHRLLVIAATNSNFVVIIRNARRGEGKKPCVYPFQKPLEKAEKLVP